MIINYLGYVSIYLFGLGIGFLLVPFVIRRNHNEPEGIELDEFYDKLFVCSKFLEEVIEAPDSNLTEEELSQLKEKVLTYQIPYVNYKVIMYYDSEFNAFMYYSNSDIVYKYLDIACRKYVLEFNCKQLYKFSEETKVVEKQATAQRGPFVTKTERVLLEKDTNRIIYKGKLEEYDKKESIIPKEITFQEFLVLQRQTPDTQLTESS
jgi:hypothetical protein